MQKSKYMKANYAMWKINAEHENDAQFADYMQELRQPDFSAFYPIEEELLAILEKDYAFSVKGKDIIDLGCGRGKEIIAFKTMGAGHCLGIDSTAEHVKQAKEIASLDNHDVDFIEADFYQLDSSYHNSFDMVYLGASLNWLDNLAGLFQNIQKLLRKGGYCFICDIHPLINMYDPDDIHVIDTSYFKSEPLEINILHPYETSGITNSMTYYFFQHTLSDIMTAAIGQGLDIKHFAEYPYDTSETYKALEEHEFSLPLSYGLILQKAS